MADSLSRLLDTYGSARRPDRPPVHRRPAGVDDATVEALGRLSAALETAEDARGHLYSFHRTSGEADLALQDALDALDAAGHTETAEIIRIVMVGRDTVAGMWTFEMVESFDADYIDPFRACERAARHAAGLDAPHVFEAEMKHREQAAGSED